MTLFLCLLCLLLLFADFLSLCFDLSLDFGTLLGGKTFLLVSLLLALGWGQVVRRGLSRATLGRARLFCRSLSWTLFDFVSLVESSILLIAVVDILLAICFFFGLGVVVSGCICVVLLCSLC